jgi:hypothetical protein
MLNKKNASLIRSRSFGGQLNKNWIERDLPRYQLAYGGWLISDKKVDSFDATLQSESVNNQKYIKVLVNDGSQMDSYGLEKIILHSSSGKLLQSPSNSAIIYLAFSTVSCQTPTKIHSKNSIAGFKLSKFALLGAKTTLRNLAKYDFYYKFFFLGASETSVTAMIRQSRITLSNGKAWKRSRGETPWRKPSEASFSQKSFSAKKSFLTLPSGKAKARKTKIVKPLAKSLEPVFEKPTLGPCFFDRKSEQKQQQHNLFTMSLAVKNVFLFNELDNLDYDAFSNMSGFEIVFVNKRH